MYANTGIATDSARRKRANNWARWIAVPCRKLFQARPMPDLRAPSLQPSPASATDMPFPPPSSAASQQFHIVN